MVSLPNHGAEAMAAGNLRRAAARLRVIVGDERGRAVRMPGVARWLARVAPARARGTVSLALVSDARVRVLNRRYRGIDRATDVLSFPVANPEPRSNPNTIAHPESRSNP